MSNSDPIADLRAQWTTAEVSAELDELSLHPLFARSQADAERSVAFAALAALAASESDENAAAALCDAANRIVARTRETTEKCNSRFLYLNALRKYGEALEKAQSDALRTRILQNAAFAQLKLRNFGEAIKLCDEALALDATALKARYRKAFALIELERFDEVKSVCEAARDSPEIVALLETAQKRQNDILAKKRKRESETEAIRARCACFGGGFRAETTIDLSRYSPRAALVDGRLVFGVALLYPESAQIDFVSAVGETRPLFEVFAEIAENGFPWDESDCYSDLENVELNVFARGKRVSLRRESNLRTLFAEFSFVLSPAIEVFVVSKASPFYNRFEQMYA